MQRFWLAMAVVGAVGTVSWAEERPMMSVSDALALPQPEAQYRVAYGSEPQQFGELRLPEGAGPHPVAIVIHGGCWLADYDLGYVSSLAAALAADGIATWSIEYRRVGDDGGGWPGTFDDVAAAADHLREIAADHALDLERVVAVGHSAGGHLALWLGARRGLSRNDGFRREGPLVLSGVVSLAGIPDLAAFASSEGCGAAVPGLLGGQPTDHPERLGRVSPIEMVPLGIPQIQVIGGLDPIVPRAQADDYATAAGDAGDRVGVKEIPSAGHFELVDPSCDAWSAVRSSVLEVLPSAD